MKDPQGDWELLQHLRERQGTWVQCCGKEPQPEVKIKTHQSPASPGAQNLTMECSVFTGSHQALLYVPNKSLKLKSSYLLGFHFFFF